MGIDQVLMGCQLGIKGGRSRVDGGVHWRELMSALQSVPLL